MDNAATYNYKGPRESIYELSEAGRSCLSAPASELPVFDMSSVAVLSDYLADEGGRPQLPAVTETDIMRHYTHLASMNFGVDGGMYPLGSCTMKYNPRLNEDAARLPGFANLHPYQPEYSTQGVLKMMYELQEDLAEIAGFAATSLQPSAGAHGEYAALMAFRAAHLDRTEGKTARTKVIIPDTAHGTNPASVAMAGYDTVTVPSSPEGLVDMDALRKLLDEDVAAFMLTNPNTLGLFEGQIIEINEACHAVGAFTYCDGANLNAILGVTRPGDMGFDALHINLHKTFSTPHGGGGPGAGPICVNEELAAYLPGPLVARLVDSEKPDEGHDLYTLVMPEKSIGRVRSFYGNVSVMARAWTYIRSLGGEGLRSVAHQAVLSANYLRVVLQDHFKLAFEDVCMHEFVLTGAPFKEAHGVRTLDVAKRLLDYGFHPPTIYFPLLVEEAMMIEPTETEPLKDLDAFADAMIAIAKEIEEKPELLQGAPYTTPVRRLDEAAAVRKPELRWRKKENV
ncbi:MAG: aminomethyl-transferring glycine dehydrogenase subunit GcvPB [Coriobacteriia bacterium]|nr:aminomethyl-transferring glycine dehydrogenase subunit GcvPB [Coriobacteriia bacterium]